MALASAPALTPGAAPRVNLMPRGEIERRQRNALVRRWGWGLVAALLLVVLVSGGAYWLQSSAQQRLDAENARTNDLLSQVAALQPVSQKLALEKELGEFRSLAMGTDLEWAGLLATVKGTLPTDVGIVEYSLAPGGLPQGDDPAVEIGAQGSIVFASAAPTDIVALIRSVRALPGVLDADGWVTTFKDSQYEYELRIAFDQSAYTGAYGAEENE